jgi:hypothetical protein
LCDDVRFRNFALIQESPIFPFHQNITNVLSLQHILSVMPPV